jgi:hypothetical protein
MSILSSDFDSVSITAYNHFFPVNLDLLLTDGDPRRLSRRRVSLGFSEIVRPVPDRTVRAINAK